jgi:DNA-binding CsgD family transcriptional regulator
MKKIEVQNVSALNKKLVVKPRKSFFAFGHRIEFLYNLPGEYNFYCKNLNGIYYLGNDVLSERVKLPLSALPGQSDFNFGPEENAKAYQSDDKKVQITNKTMTFISKVKYHSGKDQLDFFDIKTPLKSSSNQTIGTLGISYPILRDSFFEISAAINKIGMMTQRSMAELLNHQINLATKDILTTREKDCIFHLAQGKNSKQIGRALMLSHRTVEDYIENAKLKLSCPTRADLINLLWG